MARNYAETIGRLIAMAEDETLTDEARKSYRLKAEQMMREYRISEEEAIARDESAAMPIEIKITLVESNGGSNPLRQKYADLWHEIARHAGIRSVVHIVYGEDGTYNGSQVIATAIGYAGDLKLAEFLWTAARLVFLTRIDPQVNPELSDQENCYYLRNSGMKRNDIAYQLWGAAYNDGHAHGRVQKLYVAECEKRGEVPRVSGRGVQVSVYREAYATGFVRKFGWRLRESRDAADSAGGALVMHGRKERVNEAFYARFPEYRPMTDEERAKLETERLNEEANCQACKRLARQARDGEVKKCKRHRPYEITAKDRQAYYRRYESPEARAGQSAGAAAARSVDFSRSAPARRQRTEPAPEQVALGN